MKLIYCKKNTSFVGLNTEWKYKYAELSLNPKLVLLLIITRLVELHSICNPVIYKISSIFTKNIDSKFTAQEPFRLKQPASPGTLKIERLESKTILKVFGISKTKEPKHDSQNHNAEKYKYK